MDSEQLDRSVKNANDPEPKTAVLLGQESLLVCAVEFILKDWRVVRISSEESYQELLKNIEAVNPSVVIIQQDEQAFDVQLLMQLLQDCPGLKVITVNPENNSIQVYNKQRVWIKEAADLLSIVEGAC